MKLSLLSGVALFSISVCAISPARAASVFPTLGTAANYAVLGLTGSETITNSLVTINGNEAISQGGSIKNMGPSVINGNVFEYSAGQYSGSGKLEGNLVTSSTTLNQNNNDVTNALASIAANDAVANVTFNSGIHTAQTITASGASGVEVVKINGDIDLNSANLTLNGNANQYFVVEVSGGLSLVGTAELALSGGITPDHVIYDFTGTSGSITTHVGDVVDGVVIAPHLGMTLDGTFNGELISGKSITLMSGATVNQAVSAVPEPGNLAVFGAVFLTIGVVRRRRLSTFAKNRMAPDCLLRT